MKRRTLEILFALAARHRLISLAAAWTIGLVSVIMPDTTWVQIPSFANFILVVGAATSVILSFTLMVNDREVSTWQALALMSSLLTATAAMVTFQRLPEPNPARIIVLSICTGWQFVATFLELRSLVERGRVNLPQPDLEATTPSISAMTRTESEAPLPSAV